VLERVRIMVAASWLRLSPINVVVSAVYTRVTVRQLQLQSCTLHQFVFRVVL